MKGQKLQNSKPYIVDTLQFYANRGQFICVAADGLAKKFCAVDATDKVNAGISGHFSLKSVISSHSQRVSTNFNHR